MSDKWDTKNQVAYEHRPVGWQRLLLNTGADRAEWDVPAGRVGGLVRQLRRRARSAQSRSNWFFTALLAVIISALSVYIVVPLFEQVQDGNKRARETEAQFLQTQLDDMNTTRDAAWARLRTALEFVNSPHAGPDIVANFEVNTPLMRKQNTRLLLQADSNELFYTDDAGQSWIKPILPIDLTDPFVKLNPVRVSYSDTLLITSHGLESILLFGANRPRMVRFPFFVSDDDGETWKKAEANRDLNSLGLVEFREFSPELMVAQSENRLVRSTDGGLNWVETDVGFSITDETVIRYQNPYFFVYRPFNDDPDGNAISVSTDYGKNWDALNVPESFDATLSDFDFDQDKISLVASYEGRDPPPDLVFVTTDEGKTWQEKPDDDVTERLPEVIVVEEPEKRKDIGLGESSFLIEASGTAILIKKLDPVSQNLKVVKTFPSVNAIEPDFIWSDSEKTAFLVLWNSDNETINFGATVDGGVTWERVPTALPTEGFSPQAFVKSKDDFAFLLVGQNGEMRRIDRRYSGQALAVLGRAGDSQITQFLGDLNASLKSDPIVQPIVTELEASFVDRPGVTAERDATLADASAIAGSGISPVQRQRDFVSFLTSCLDAAKEAKGDIDCTAAYKELRELEKISVWEFVGQKAPQGILLLFLLATLAGLYRYNLRLSGFHHSRADALELLSILHGDAQNLPKDDLLAFTALADQMAADKVEFGKSGTPTDQAVELARIISQRS